MMRSKTFSFFAYSVLLMSSSLFLMAEPKLEYIELPPALVEQLSSDDFEVREKAYAGLHKWSEENIKASPELLYKAWKGNDDPEAQARCYSLMREMLLLRKRFKGRGFLGIQMTGLVLPAKLGGQAGRQAVRVNQVLPNTPAQKVGLRAGDLILRVDELDLSSANHGVEDRQWELIAGIHAIEKFSAYIKFKQPDEKVTLHLLRGDKRMEKEVVLMKFDPPKDLDPEKMKTEFDAFLSEAFLKEWLKKMKLDTKSK